METFSELRLWKGLIAFSCTNPFYFSFEFCLIDKKNIVLVLLNKIHFFISTRFLYTQFSIHFSNEIMADFDAIYQDDVVDEVLEEVVALSPEPIVIRGAGNMTV